MKARSSILTVLSMFLACLCFGQVLGKERFVIVVGHNLGHPGEDPLRFAERDATRFADLMVELGGVSRRNVTRLLGPTPNRLRTALNRLRDELRAEEKAQESKLVFFFYAGHADGKNLHLGKQVFSRQELIRRMSDFPAKVKLVFLDACQTPRVSRPRGVRAGPRFDIGVLEPDSVEGLVIIQSTRLGEPAHESDVLEGAVFTHYLLSSLRGAGDLDRDGRITLLEAYSFAYRRTVGRSARQSAVIQHPTFEIDLSGSGDLVLTRPIEANAAIILPTGPEATYLVFQQPSGAVLAEAISSPSHSLSVAVPPGRLLVQRRLSHRYQVAEVDLPFGGRYRLSVEDFVDQPYEKIARRRGAWNLYSDAFSAGYVFRSDWIDSEQMSRHGLCLSYHRELGVWLMGAQLFLGQSVTERSHWSTEEVILALGARFGRWISLGSSRLEVSLGPEIQWVDQKRQRADRHELEKFGIQVPDPTHRSAWGLGGGVEIAWRLELGRRFSLFAAFRSSLLGIRLQKANSKPWTAIWALGGSVGLGYRF